MKTRNIRPRPAGVCRVATAASVLACAALLFPFAAPALSQGATEIPPPGGFNPRPLEPEAKPPDDKPVDTREAPAEPAAATVPPETAPLPSPPPPAITLAATEARDPADFAAVRRALAERDDEALAALVSAADPDSKDGNGLPLLHLLLDHGKLPAARLLLAAGADPDLADADGATALARAAERGDDDAVSLLLGRHARPDFPDAAGVTPLMRASARGRLSTVERLLDAGAAANARNAAGETALFLCARSDAYSSAVIAKLLLARGADPNARNNAGVCALAAARAAGSRFVENLLLEAGAAEPGASDDPPGRRPVVSACEQVVITPKPKPDPESPAAANAPAASPVVTLPESESRPPADFAAIGKALAEGEEERLRSLVAAAEPNSRDAAGKYLVHHLAEKGAVAALGVALDAGADPDVRDESTGLTPLAILAAAGSVEGVDLLLAKGARLDEPCADGSTPLLAAIAAGQAGCARKLIEAGARPDAVDGKGASALTACLDLKGDAAADCAALLAEKGCDVNERDAQGKTLLERARERKNEALEKRLLELGAEEPPRGEGK